MKRELRVASEEQMVALGDALSRGARAPLAISLSGDLAAGKTTFARGFIRAQGHAGAVKSPTFTLVESYLETRTPCHHFDLYRIADAEELEYLGLDEYFDGTSHCLVEWPERGSGALPPFDLSLVLEVSGPARTVLIESATAIGDELLEELPKYFDNSESCER